MPKEIKYEKIDTARLTPCPNNVKATICFRVEAIINVGSTACEQCKHYKGEDENKQIVTCSYEEEQ